MIDIYWIKRYRSTEHCTELDQVLVPPRKPGQLSLMTQVADHRRFRVNYRVFRWSRPPKRITFASNPDASGSSSCLYTPPFSR